MTSFPSSVISTVSLIATPNFPSSLSDIGKWNVIPGCSILISPETIETGQSAQVGGYPKPTDYPNVWWNIKSEPAFSIASSPIPATSSNVAPGFITSMTLFNVL